MTKKMSEYFMAYEAAKVFVIWKMKTQFTKKIRIFYAQTYYRSMQCRRKLFFIGGGEIEGRRPEEIFKIRVSEMPFPGLWGKF
jgi:hypothetical protein